MSKTTIKTLRYYDEVGLLKPEAVDRFTGYRLYTTGQLVLLHRIQSLRQIGLSIEEITRMLSGGPERAIQKEADEIFRSFAEIRESDPAAAPAQALVRRWQARVTAHHYDCGPEILAALGQMYVGDARFAENLDRFGEGTAAFMGRAIAHYCHTLEG